MFVGGEPGDGAERSWGSGGAERVSGGGGALLPGLHDHHLHLMAMAAQAASVACGPPEVRDRVGLAERLRAAAAVAPPGRWVRGTGYDDSVAGPLDAYGLDELLGPHREVPVRVQHRSGHLWVLNGSGVEEVQRTGGLGTGTHGPGVYLDLDGELRSCWASGPEGDGLEAGLESGLAAAGRRLARLGITGVTDATVANGHSELSAFEAARRAGALPQGLHLLGGHLPEEGGTCVSLGARKIVLAEHALPGLDELAAEMAGAGRRGVAVHCASREALVLAAAALRMAPGVRARVEHAAVAPPEVVELLSGRVEAVVTQPGFVLEHGDRYRREVDPVDLPWLYRLRAWQLAGVGLAGSSDAPFGELDPWSAMRAATERRTAAGFRLGPEERLGPEAARDLYLGPLEDPGGPARRVEPGAPADLCLLSVPWRTARADLSGANVRSTYVGGLRVAGE